jgi:hypothetical protein
MHVAGQFLPAMVVLHNPMQEVEPIGVVAEDISALVTAGGGVIASTHPLNAQWSCHGEN